MTTQVWEVPASAGVFAENLPLNLKDAPYRAREGMTPSAFSSLVGEALDDLNTLGGGSLCIPRGLWDADYLPIDHSNVEIFGEHGTVLRATPGIAHASFIRGNTTLVNVNPPTLENVSLRDLRLDFQGDQQDWAGGAGLSGGAVFYAINRLKLKNIYAKNGLNSCISTYGCTDVDARELTAETCRWLNAANPIVFVGTADVYSDDLMADGIRIKHTTSYVVSASAAAGTATFDSGATPHGMRVGQPIKVTGMIPVAYNGFWTITAVPSTTTFQVSLGSSPAASSQSGLAFPYADRGLQINIAHRAHVANVHAQGAVSPVDAEVGSPGAYDFIMDGIHVYDFINRGVAVSQTSGTGTIQGHRGNLRNFTVRGVDGTTEFGRPGQGSLTGLILTGEHLGASDGEISNVREGYLLGLAANTEEDDFTLNNIDIQLAADSTASGGRVGKAQTQPLKRLRMDNVNVDGQGNANSLDGFDLQGRVVDYRLVNCSARGMGRHGFHAENGGGSGPTDGKIIGSDFLDNAGQGIYAESATSGLRIGGHTRSDRNAGYGLQADAGASGIILSDKLGTANTSGEVNDLTATGIARRDHRDPRGLGGVRGYNNGGTTAQGTMQANTAFWVQVTDGSDTISKIGFYCGTLDTSSPGTSDQCIVFVYRGKMPTKTSRGRSRLPDAQAATSALTPLTANAFNQISLTAAVDVGVGDYLGLWLPSGVTQLARMAVANGGLNLGLAAIQASLISAQMLALTTAAASGGCTLIPDLVGIP